MRTFLLTLFLILFCFGGSLRAQGNKPAPKMSTVALMKMNAVGVNDKDLRAIKSGLRAASQRIGSFAWMPESQVRRRVKKFGDLERQIQALGADYVLTGTVGGFGDTLSLDLRVFDGQRAKLLRRVAVEVPLSLGRQAPVLDELLVQLLRPERWVGSLDLKVSEAGAQVMLDGLVVATTPLERPLSDLVPGKHILMVSKQGFRDLSQFVEIRYNRVFQLEVDLSNSTVVGQLYEHRKPSRPKPEPKPVALLPVVVEEKAPESKWQNVTGLVCLGAGAAVAAAGGLLVWHAADIERQLSDSRPSIDDQEELESLYDEGRRSNRWGNGLLIAGAAVSAASAVFFIWAWLDSPAGADASSESSTSVGASLLPGGLGLSLLRRF